MGRNQSNAGDMKHAERPQEPFPVGGMALTEDFVVGGRMIHSSSWEIKGRKG